MPALGWAAEVAHPYGGGSAGLPALPVLTPREGGDRGAAGPERPDRALTIPAGTPARAPGC